MRKEENFQEIIIVYFLYFQLKFGSNTRQIRYFWEK